MHDGPSNARIIRVRRAIVRQIFGRVSCHAPKQSRLRAARAAAGSPSWYSHDVSVIPAVVADHSGRKRGRRARPEPLPRALYHQH